MQLAVWVDDFALRSLPRLEERLARAAALVMRSFVRLPNPAMVAQLSRYRQVAVIGGRDFHHVLSRVEAATTSLKVGVIAALPVGAAGPGLRGPGVLDVLPANTADAAERITLMASVPIVSGRARPEALTPRAVAATPSATPTTPSSGALVLGPDAAAVAIAGSTGGCWVMAEVIRALPAAAAAPILLAQHMDADFVPFFARWLESSTGRRTVLVSGRVPLEPGALHVAEGGCDLCVDPDGRHAVSSPASERFIPSANRLFRTFARAFGPRGSAVVLSGMGEDGSLGLIEVVREGGTAMCQAPATAIVPSMPECALRAAPGALSLTPEAIVVALSATQAFRS